MTKGAAPHLFNWPPRYRPEEATFYVHNEIDIDATPEEVWETLIEAEVWPDWYEGAANVEVSSSPSGKLRAGAVLSWETMGLEFASRIIEFDPPYRLSWESRTSTIQGYHAWLIFPSANGVRVVAVESQHGFLATMQRVYLPDTLRELHDIWLQGMKARAEARSRRATPTAANSRSTRP